jgi:hypothetical protein
MLFLCLAYDNLYWCSWRQKYRQIVPVSTTPRERFSRVRVALLTLVRPIVFGRTRGAKVQTAAPRAERQVLSLSKL